MKTILIEQDMGGEVQDFIKKVQGKRFVCTCGTSILCRSFLAYPHDGGLKDKDKNGWWVYVHCSNCGYDWSFWKIENRIKRIRILEAN